MRFRKTEFERWAAEERRLRDREQMQARRAERRERKEALWREQAARRAATTTLAYLGVAVRGGEVFPCSLEVVIGRVEGSPLGDLAGARADVMGGAGGIAFVVFADGTRMRSGSTRLPQGPGTNSGHLPVYSQISQQ